MTTAAKSNPRSTPSPEAIRRHLLRANEVAKRAIQHGKHPFGAVLVGPDHETVLMEQANIDTVRHAEVELARRAAREFSPDYLWQCTLYTTVEPCAMCATTAYWANIGRIAFGLTEEALLVFTGNHPENPTMSVSSRYIVEHGQKPIDVIGPVAAVREEIGALHQTFWKRG